MFVGPFLGRGTDAWVGAEQLLSKNSPGANVFVVIGQGWPRRSSVTGVMTPTVLSLVGLALAYILCCFWASVGPIPPGGIDGGDRDLSVDPPVGAESLCCTLSPGRDSGDHTAGASALMGACSLCPVRCGAL